MKKTKTRKITIGRPLGAEAFLALVHKTAAGPMNDRRRPSRAIARRRAITEEEHQ